MFNFPQKFARPARLIFCKIDINVIFYYFQGNEVQFCFCMKCYTGVCSTGSEIEIQIGSSSRDVCDFPHISSNQSDFDVSIKSISMLK